MQFLLLDARSCQGILHYPPRSGSEFAHQEWRILQHGDIDLMICPFMACGNYQNHMVFHKRFDMDVFSISRTFNQSQLDSMRVEGIEHLIAVPAGRGDGDTRILTKEPCYKIGQKILSDCL